jgi:hypothetical protein
MNRQTEKSIEMAQLHRKLGNDGAYARIISALHREAPTVKVQNEIKETITKDGTGAMFGEINNAMISLEEWRA